MDQLGLVPDVFDELPTELLQVSYESGNVKFGQELEPKQVKDQPQVKWTNIQEDDAFYTLCLTDPDVPSRQQHDFREVVHWLVVNIPGGDITKGEVVFQYVGSGPRQGSGLHRYVFALYKQPEKLEFSDVTRYTDIKSSLEGRRRFSIRKFAKTKAKASGPIAVNCYQAQWDDYVPQIHAMLGVK